MKIYQCDEIAHGRSQIIEKEYLKQREAGHETLQAKFNYAWVLIKSPVYDHQVLGVRLLQGMYRVPYCCFVEAQRAVSLSPCLDEI